MSSGIIFERVAHAYGATKILHDVSLSVEPGQILCLLGPSASGKTTLLRLAAGLERLQSGRIIIADVLVAGDGADVPPEKRGVGFVFQDFALFPHLSVADNIAYGLSRLSPARRHARVHELVAAVGLEASVDAYPHTLSGGQQQRVALARALAPQPAAMLLDEPFSGLDATLRSRLRDDTLHILNRTRVAAVMVTHDAEEAMFMADRIAVIDRGRIVQWGSPIEIYNKPATGFVARLFGDVNRLDGIAHGGAVATPFGLLPAPLASADLRVEILIRPEGLILERPNGRAGAVRARVLAARLLGRTSLIHLSLEGDESGAFHLHARVPGDNLPLMGEIVAIRLDPRKAFVFAAD